MTLYGQLTPLELDERETTVKATVFNLATTVNVVFNSIQRFQDLCTLLKCPKPDNQLVAMAYIIFFSVVFFSKIVSRLGMQNQMLIGLMTT